VTVTDTPRAAPEAATAEGDDGPDGTRPSAPGGCIVRRVAVGIALTGVLVLSACGSGGAAPAASTAPASPKPSATTAKPAPAVSSPPASPVDTATPDPSMSAPPTVAPTSPLVDYGAVLSVWAAHHTADERFDPGAMWDATPGWGPDEANNDKVNSMVLTGGRVLDYVLYLPRPSVSAAKATSLALAALPKDATVLWTKRFAACSVVQLTSASLAKAVAGKPFLNPKGQVQLVLLSGSAVAPSATFDPAKVGSVLVRSTQARTAADFAGC
jgi:hypothetical protein